MSHIAVVLVVGLLIAVHEYGHLLAARLCGIPIRQFPIGGYVLPAIDLDDRSAFLVAS